MKFVKKRNTNNYNFREASNINVVIHDDEKYEKEVFRFTLLLECIYAFFFGYNLFFMENNFKELMLLFFGTLLLSLCFIKLPYELIKGFAFKLTSDNNEIVMKYSFIRFYYNVETKGYTDKSSIILSLITPIVFLTLLPTTISFLLGFNVIAYAVAIACSILSARDIIDLIYVVKWVPHESKIKHIDNNYILKI